MFAVQGQKRLHAALGDLRRMPSPVYVRKGNQAASAISDLALMGGSLPCPPSQWLSYLQACWSWARPGGLA